VPQPSTSGKKPQQPPSRGSVGHVPAATQEALAEPKEILGVSRKYPALGILHQIIVAFGVVISSLGVLGVIYVVENINKVSSETIYVALTPLATLLAGIVIAAFGQLLKVFMDIEANTRELARRYPPGRA
jgi:hypothetical protein